MCDLHSVILTLFLNIMIMDFYMLSFCIKNKIVKELDCALIVTRDDRWLCVFEKIQLYQQSSQPNNASK